MFARELQNVKNVKITYT